MRLSLLCLGLVLLSELSHCTREFGLDDLSYIRQQLPLLRENVMQFWLKHGKDEEYGAFHGTLDLKGVPIDPDAKGLFQTGRHLWSMSYYYSKFGNDPKAKELADNVWDFIWDHFFDKTEHRMYFKVLRDGSRIPDSKANETTNYVSTFHTQANWFGLLGVALYAKVFDSQEAKDAALDAYRAWKEVAWDEELGGYMEDKDIPKWTSGNVTKTISVQTHGAEILALIYDATGDEEVAKDLVRLTEVSAAKIILDKGRASMSFTQDWTPVEPEGYTMDFSAEMQTWMLIDIVDMFPDLFSEESRKMVYERVLWALRHAVLYSYDQDSGSFCSSGLPEESCVGEQEERVWYYQTEGAFGLYYLYKYAKDENDKAHYLGKLAKLIRFVSEKQVDWQHGEMYYTINTQGKEVGPTSGIKGGEWKASYHSGRMVMFLEKWLAA